MAEPGWLSNGERLRAGWRILVFLALFVALAVVGQLVLSVLPNETLGWAGLLLNTAAALAAGWIVLSRLDGRPLGALGFPWHRDALREVWVGGLAGAALLALAVVLLLATGSARFLPDEGSAGAYLGMLLSTLLFFALAAALEELLFRGYAFQALVEGLGAVPAVLISSALFSWLHGQNPNITPLAFANLFLAGVLLALAYLRTRSLWFATAVHVGWNWATATLFDFPVSGLTGFDTPLYGAQAVGPAWWTGAEFGPEGGLSGTLALLLGLFWLARTPRLGESEHLRALGPIVDRRLRPAEPALGAAPGKPTTRAHV